MWKKKFSPFTNDYTKVCMSFALLVAIIVILFVWPEIWKRGELIREAATAIEELQADKAELAGDLQDLRQDRYYQKYSFQFVMNILIAKTKQYGIPINVALALLQIESSFNAQAISATGDYGYFQINEKSWKFDKARIFEPEYNIDLGLKILQGHYKQAGSWAMALALYNAGKNYERSEHPKKLSESIFMR